MITTEVKILNSSWVEGTENLETDRVDLSLWSNLKFQKLRSMKKSRQTPRRLTIKLNKKEETVITFIFSRNFETIFNRHISLLFCKNLTNKSIFQLTLILSKMSKIRYFEFFENYRFFTLNYLRNA